MKPYYQDDAVRIYHGDCREVLPQLEPMDLMVTSPPYNVARDYGDAQNDRLPVEEYQKKLTLWIRVMADALRSGGTLALNLPSSIRTRVNNDSNFKKLPGYHPPDGIATIESIHRSYPIGAWATIEMSKYLIMRESIVCVKSAHEGEAYATSLAIGNVANPFIRPCHELIILGSKDRYNRDGTDGRLHPIAHVDWLKDVWHISAYKRGTQWNTGHPAPFPLELPSRLILLFSEPGQIICDPMCGSGSTLRAVKDLDRNAIGIEIEEKYCEIAAKRMSQEILNFK